jgi:hypothetical protein
MKPSSRRTPKSPSSVMRGWWGGGDLARSSPDHSPFCLEASYEPHRAQFTASKHLAWVHSLFRSCGNFMFSELKCCFGRPPPYYIVMLLPRLRKHGSASLFLLLKHLSYSQSFGVYHRKLPQQRLYRVQLRTTHPYISRARSMIAR